MLAVTLDSLDSIASEQYGKVYGVCVCVALLQKVCLSRHRLEAGDSCGGLTSVVVYQTWQKSCWTSAIWSAWLQNQECTSKDIWRQGVALTKGNSLQREPVPCRSMPPTRAALKELTSLLASGRHVRHIRRRRAGRREVLPEVLHVLYYNHLSTTNHIKCTTTIWYTHISMCNPLTSLGEVASVHRA